MLHGLSFETGYLPRTSTGAESSLDRVPKKLLSIGDHKDSVCLLLYGQVSWQPKRCRSAMLDPKDRAFCYLSGSL